jgi:hypothetical protein
MRFWVLSSIIAEKGWSSHSRLAELFKTQPSLMGSSFWGHVDQKIQRTKKWDNQPEAGQG